MDIISLTHSDFDEQSLSLYKLVKSDGYNPELVISIATGGDFVVESFNLPSEIKSYSIKKQRVSTKTKDGASWFFYVLNKMPLFVANVLRRVEHAIRCWRFDVGYENKENCNCISYGIDFYPDVKRILIVDDAVDTGETLRCICHCVQDLYQTAEIRTAVIVTTIKDSYFKPYYSLYENVLVRFPWSKDARI